MWHLDDNALRMPRTKQRSVAISVVYRATRLLKRVLGRPFVLRLYLNIAWLSRRLAFELSGELFGDGFYSSNLALSEDVLERWIPRGGTVVDVGCGTGRWSRVATRFAGHVVGVDLNSERIESARHSPECAAGGSLEYVCGDAEEVLATAHYDTALLIHVIEHVENADKLLTHLRNSVKIVMVEVPDFDAEPLNYVRHRLGCRFDSDGDHVREYTCETLGDQLRRCGWIVREWRHRGGAMLAVAEGADTASLGHSHVAT